MKHIRIACLYTLVTAVILGIAYPVLITGVAQITMPWKANGQIIEQNGQAVGSALIGQSFSGAAFFHSRPSAAGTGYDASASSGSNLAPTNKALIDRVAASVKSESSGAPVPVDLVTASASGLDPDITPEAAFYQVHRVAAERRLSNEAVESLVQQNITPRQFGILGEPRVNVLRLNLALEKLSPTSN